MPVLTTLPMRRVWPSPVLFACPASPDGSHAKGCPERECWVCGEPAKAIDPAGDLARCPSCGHVAADECQCTCCPQECDHPLPSVDTFRQVCKDCGEPVSDEIADEACERWAEAHYGVKR